jgi:hypothetical protein
VSFWNLEQARIGAESELLESGTSKNRGWKWVETDTGTATLVNRPWRSTALWEVEVPTFSRQSTQRLRRGCSFTRRPPYPPRKNSSTHLC